MKNINTLFLTGLRGYSALAVFFIHSSGGGFYTLGGWASKMVDHGKYGVISFFVLSALTLSMSIDRSKVFSYSRYLMRRFARIFPMYSLVVIAFWWLGVSNVYNDTFGVAPRDIYDLFMHLTFLNAWDVRYQSTIIGPGWTVPIEMWTYLIIPSLFFYLKNAGHIQKWTVFVVFLGLALMDSLWHKEWLGAHWAVENYTYCFIGGILAYSYLDKIKLSKGKADILVLLLIIVALFPPGGGRVLELWYTLLVMVLIPVLTQAGITRLIFENRLIVLLGNISFSFYLLHGSILNYFRADGYSELVTMMAALVTTTGIAYLCHILVERPALRLTGKKYRYD